MDLVQDKRLEQIALKIMSENSDAMVLFKTEMFSTLQHVLIYDRISKAYEDGVKLDKNLLISYLSSDEKFVDFGINLVNKIFDLEYEDQFIDEYARKLKKLATLRKSQINLYTLAENIKALGVPELVGKIDEIRQEVFKDADISDEDNSLKALMDEELLHLFSGPRKGQFVETGFEDFDTLIGGFEAGDLVIIAGRPSMGKTSLMLRWILNIAKKGIPSEIYSYEMSNSQIVRRLLSMESGIPTNRLQKGLFSPEEEEGLKILITQLKPIPLKFRYSIGQEITDLSNHIRLSSKLNGTKVFAIDYAQLMSLTPGRETQDLNRIARSLKNLAVELGLVIVLLSQLNRAVEMRKNKRPMLSDLRQAGGLEESSDKIIFIYRHYYYSKSDDDLGMGELMLSKNRNGPIADFNVMFREETTNFWV